MFVSCLCLVVWGVRHSEKYSVDNQALLGSVATRNVNPFELLVSDCALPLSIVAPFGAISLVNVRTGVFSVCQSRNAIFFGWFWSLVWCCASCCGHSTRAPLSGTDKSRGSFSTVVLVWFFCCRFICFCFFSFFLFGVQLGLCGVGRRHDRIYSGVTFEAPYFIYGL